MKKSYFIPLIFAFLVSSCQKPDPNPENRDLIYQDYLAQKGEAEKNVIEAQKKVDEFAQEMKNAEPLTGQYKRSQKKFFEMQNRVSQLKQQLRYWEIRIGERLVETRVNYNKAFKEKTPWPDPGEFERYFSDKKLRAAKINWDQKQRVELFKTESQQQKAAGH